MRAGIDVYCEKPLTIDEGKIIRRAVKETGRVFQVGTQQRSDREQKFLTAVALAQSGRVGRIKRVTCSIGGTPKGGAFATQTSPPCLDWDLWLGQAPKAEYVAERCHNTFR